MSSGMPKAPIKFHPIRFEIQITVLVIEAVQLDAQSITDGKK
jgi:hypothetical protein